MKRNTQAQEIAGTEVTASGIGEHRDVPAQRNTGVAFANRLQANTGVCISMKGLSEPICIISTGQTVSRFMFVAGLKSFHSKFPGHMKRTCKIRIQAYPHVASSM